MMAMAREVTEASHYAGSDDNDLAKGDESVDRVYKLFGDYGDETQGDEGGCI
jgi:hypothetical protein